MGTRFWRAAALGMLVIVAIGVVAVVAYNAGLAQGTPAEAGEASEAWRGYGHPFWGGWFFFPVFPLLFTVLFIFVVSGVIRSAWFGGPRGWHRGDLDDWHRRAHGDAPPANPATSGDAAPRSDQ